MHILSHQIHMRQHTGEKPLHCKTCKFASRDPSVLRKHQLRHNKDATKLKCSRCNFTCIQANAYKRHMRVNHPEDYKKISCDLCSYVTVNEEKLKAHKDDHRKGLIRNNDDSQSARKTQKRNEVCNIDMYTVLCIKYGFNIVHVVQYTLSSISSHTEHNINIHTSQ